jgi:hypothetical protein
MYWGADPSRAQRDSIRGVAYYTNSFIFLYPFFSISFLLLKSGKVDGNGQVDGIRIK